MYFMIAIIMNLLEAKEPQGMVAARKQAVSQSVSQSNIPVPNRVSSKRKLLIHKTTTAMYYFEC